MLVSVLARLRRKEDFAMAARAWTCREKEPTEPPTRACQQFTRNNTTPPKKQLVGDRRGTKGQGSVLGKIREQKKDTNLSLATSHWRKTNRNSGGRKNKQQTTTAAQHRK